MNNFFNSIYIDTSSMTNKKLSKYRNDITRMNVCSQLCNEALHRYDVEGLPENCDPRVVYESLLYYGSVCFFKEGGNILALPGLPTESYTLYGNPTKAIVHGRNGYVKEIKLFSPNGDNSKLVRTNTMGTVETETGTGVWIRENYLAYPFINYVMDFTDKIADTYRTLDITRANIKRPYIVTCEESMLKSVKEFFNRRDNNENYIVSSGVFPANKINLLPFDSNPESIRDATGLIDFYFSKFRELCSVSAAPATIDKKAEITIPELNQNSGAQDIQRFTVANVLQEGFDFVNDVLATNIRFKSNTEEKLEKEEKENDNISGVQNEE